MRHSVYIIALYFVWFFEMEIKYDDDDDDATRAVLYTISSMVFAVRPRLYLRPGFY